MSIFSGLPQKGGDERIYSVTTGLVKTNWDKDHPGMVQVEYFMGTEGKNVTGWMPVMASYAFKDCGMYALPEIGSEVVLAFNMGDRNCPIVIGCLWNRKNKLPDQTAAENNTIKRFCTKAGSEIVFNDETDKEKIMIRTPKELEVVIDDENEAIALQDKNRKNGISIHAKDGTIKIYADKNITLEAGGHAVITLDKASAAIQSNDIKADASKSFEVKGQSVKLGGTQTAVEGKSQLEMKSGGVTQIKGSMLKLN